MAFRKRVLISACLYGAGGRETHLLKLSRSLVSAGAEVTVVARIADAATPFIKESTSIPVKLIATPFAVNRHWLRLSTLWAIMFWPLVLRSRSFDVLYTFDISRFTGFLMRFLATNGRLILNRAGNLMTKEDWPSKRLPRPDAIIVESDLQARALGQFLADNTPVFSLPTLGHYDNPPQHSKKLSNGSLRVSFIGRYEENKGVYRLLNVWPHLIGNDLRLSFYGNGDHKRLKKGIATRALTACVSVKQGWQTPEDLAEILGETDLVVLPSCSEGLPLVLLEAMAHGVPFVATNVGAVCTLAEENPDVLIVENDDESLTKGIMQMANSIRSGDIDGSRLQNYHRNRFDFETLSQLWVRAVLGGDTGASATETYIRPFCPAKPPLDQK